MTARGSARPGSGRRLPLPAPTRLSEAAKIVAWGIAVWGGVQLVASVLARHAAASLVAQVALAEWGAGTMAITWSDPLASVPSWKAVSQRVSRGAALGGGVAAAGIAGAVATHAAAIAPSTPAFGPLAVGLVVATLGAVRDELILRGVVLRATLGLLPVWAALVACGGAAAAARFGVDGVVTSAMASEALRGVALGGLWLTDRGAWMACAANAAWMWTGGSVVRGGLLDVRFLAESQGAPSQMIVLAVAALSASLWGQHRRGGVTSSRP